MLDLFLSSKPFRSSAEGQRHIVTATSGEEGRTQRYLTRPLPQGSPARDRRPALPSALQQLTTPSLAAVPARKSH
jgi:hypothetical protein